jgi:hypothetical protein
MADKLNEHVARERFVRSGFVDLIKEDVNNRLIEQ